VTQLSRPIPIDRNVKLIGSDAAQTAVNFTLFDRLAFVDLSFTSPNSNFYLY
jgi:hypothetical protein